MSTLINLCFHGIGRPRRVLEEGESAYWIEDATYRRVLDLAVEDPRIRLSFDDGNASDVELGLPALLERGLTATFFLLAGRLDQPGSVSRADVQSLVSAGMRVGSHGMDHRPWRGLDAAGLDRELVDARIELEAVSGTAVEQVALPLGRYDRRILHRLRRTGYAAVHTSDRTWARSGAWLQPRFSLRAGDSVDTVRREMLTRASVGRRAKRHAVVAAKRWC